MLRQAWKSSYIYFQDSFFTFVKVSETNWKAMCTSTILKVAESVSEYVWRNRMVWLLFLTQCSQTHRENVCVNKRVSISALGKYNMWILDY